MEKPSRRGVCIYTAVVSLIFFLWLCRMLGIPRVGGCNVLRSTLYPALYIYWGFTLRRRLIHPQVRHFCISIAALNVFWFLMRSIRYSNIQGYDSLMRYLWYCYYLGMLFIPLFGLLTAMSVGLPETRHLPKKTAVLYLITGALFLMVLTNDFHQFVFTFPDNGLPWGAGDYGYAPGYYLVSAWMFVCYMASLIIFAVKSRRPGTRRWVLLPCVPTLFTVLYWISYITGVGFANYFRDLTAFSCVIAAMSVEFCIMCGFIRSNTVYDGLFRVTNLAVQIADSGNAVRLKSANAGQLTEEQITAAEKHPVFLNRTTLLKSSPIRFGHVLWQEDISELAEAIEDIEENCRDLDERGRIDREKLDAQKTLLSVQEKNRAADMLHCETAGQLGKIDGLLSRYDSETDEAGRRRLLASAAVIGSYVKRYGNLLLVHERAEAADIADLSRCFEESFSNLELLETECLCTLPSGLMLRTDDMLRVYRTFEAVLEDCLPQLSQVWVNGREKDGLFVLTMDFVCGISLSRHAPEADSFSSDAGTSRFTFRLQKGGAAE